MLIKYIIIIIISLYIELIRIYQEFVFSFQKSDYDHNNDTVLMRFESQVCNATYRHHTKFKQYIAIYVGFRRNQIVK
jgi:hypothetical protein